MNDQTKNTNNDYSGYEEDETPEVICWHPQHNPPQLQPLPDRMKYRHICPRCKNILIIRAHNLIYTDTE